MLRRRRHNHAPQLSSLFRVELGYDLPERLSLRGELAALSRLGPSNPGLRPTAFGGASDVLSNRHAYVSKLVPSPDGALLAVAGNDARLELHEHGDDSGESLRLTLTPSPGGHVESARDWTRLSAVAWAAPGGAESIIMGFENRHDVWLFDLQTCSVDKPTRKLRLSPGLRYHGPVSTNVADLVTVDNECFAACLNSGEVKLFDMRATMSRSMVTGTFRTGFRNAVVDAQGMYIYAAGAGLINMYDRRMSHADGGSSSVKSFGGKGSSLKGQEVLARKRIGYPEDSGASFLKALPGGAPGCVVYQTSSGSVGYADVPVPDASGEHIMEDSQTATGKNEASLDEFGTAGRAMHRSWFIKRRQCDVVVGQRGRGWKVIAPLVHKTGIRIVSFGPGLKTRSVNILKGKGYTCVHVPSPTMAKFFMGCENYSIESLEANFDRSVEDSKTEDAV